MLRGVSSFTAAGRLSKTGAVSFNSTGAKATTGFGAGGFGQFFAGQKIFGEQLARLEKFRRGPAGFADGRVVIVAGRVRLERPVAAGPQPERRAAVRHVNAERRVVREHVFEVGEIFRGVAEMMRLAPGVEPAGIKFAANQRAGRLECAEFLEIASRGRCRNSPLETNW